ncbi:hypothetical protein KR52_06865 [Synechococcus sp. KORDI-52]|nr:hypothetical protein KR52_06865 [Synechococcus sp. KORDI-52]
MILMFVKQRQGGCDIFSNACLFSMMINMHGAIETCRLTRANVI